jgi:septum formation protein
MKTTDTGLNLSVLSVGDINCDVAYNELPIQFFSQVRPPGEKLTGPLKRAAGGTGVIFATGAKDAGFQHCSVLGVIGGDDLGTEIQKEMHDREIEILLPQDFGRKTSMALLLRDSAKQDTSLTITDARQALPRDVVERVRPDIQKADVLYLSGYCLIDPSRRDQSCDILRLAKREGALVVLDVPVDMDKFINFDVLRCMTGMNVDVLVSELPEILRWLGHDQSQQTDFDFIRQSVIPKLREAFQAVFLRTSNYSYEIIGTPSGFIGPHKLDYSDLPAGQRTGYADQLTARHLYDYLAPRMVLASASPRRYDLLTHLIARNKIEVRISDIREMDQKGEPPQQRVCRLALMKARSVLQGGRFCPTAEIIVGADTEIVTEGQGGLDEIIKAPKNADEATAKLRQLAGKVHKAITGLAVCSVHPHPQTGQVKEIVGLVSTDVHIRDLSAADIENYVHSGEPIDKAGGIGIQGKGGIFVSRIQGSYSNVVGLPLERLAEILACDFGTTVWDLDKMSNWRFSQTYFRKLELCND